MAMQGNVYIWFNAFLPKIIPGVTEILKNGPNAGKSVIPMPTNDLSFWKLPLLGAIAIRNLGRFEKYGNAGFLTDQRGFSDDIDASARIKAVTKINLDTLAATTSFSTSGTRLVGIDDGAVRDVAYADLSECKSSPLFEIEYDQVAELGTSQPSSSANKRIIRAIEDARRYVQPDTHARAATSQAGFKMWVRGEASDPLVNGAPNLDFAIHYAIGIDSQRGTLIIRCFGKVDGLVDVECYAEYQKNKKGILAYNELNPSLTALLGYPSNPILGGVTFSRTFDGLSHNLLPTRSPSAAPHGPVLHHPQPHQKAAPGRAPNGTVRR